MTVIQKFPVPARKTGNSMVQSAASLPCRDLDGAAAMPKYRSRVLIVAALALFTWAVCFGLLLFAFGVLEP